MLKIVTWMLSIALILFIVTGVAKAAGDIEDWNRDGSLCSVRTQYAHECATVIGLYENSSDASTAINEYKNAYLSGYSNVYISTSSNLYVAGYNGIIAKYSSSPTSQPIYIAIFPRDGVLPSNHSAFVSSCGCYGSTCPTVQVDTDGDGIYDDEDSCPNTPANYDIDSSGCANGSYNGETISCNNIPDDVSSSGSITFGGVDYDHHYIINVDNLEMIVYCGDGSYDSDGDGVVNDDDLCPGTASGAAVDSNGCSCDQGGDGDEIPGGCSSGTTEVDYDAIGDVMEDVLDAWTSGNTDYEDNPDPIEQDNEELTNTLDEFMDDVEDHSVLNWMDSSGFQTTAVTSKITFTNPFNEEQSHEVDFSQWQGEIDMIGNLFFALVALTWAVYLFRG